MAGENRAGLGRREAAYPKVRGRARTTSGDGLQPARHTTELADGATSARSPSARARASADARHPASRRGSPPRAARDPAGPWSGGDCRPPRAASSRPGRSAPRGQRRQSSSPEPCPRRRRSPRGRPATRSRSDPQAPGLHPRGGAYCRYIGAILRKFFADRGTHLAAMIAYFALLSFVPLLFLSLAVLSTAGQANSGSFFIRELHRASPSTSLDSLLRAVRAIRENATALGLLGVAFLAWPSLALFSVLESAFNIVSGRPNRPFLRGKALATMMMIGSLAFLFGSLVVGSVGAEILTRYTGIGDSVVFANAVSVGVSLVGVFIFLSSAYVVLTNDDLSWREVELGAAVAAAVLEATFQLLPAFVRLSKHNPGVQTLSGPAVLLVWLYVMAHVIVLGAEINWHRRYGVPRSAPAPHALDESAPVSSRRRAPRLSGRSPRG